MSDVLLHIRIAAALASLAIVAAGCSATTNATSGQGEQPYKTMYGISSEGTTTDLYTEFFGPRRPPPAPATTVAATEPVQPVTTQPIAPVQPTTTQPTAAVRSARPSPIAPATATNRTPQPIASQPAQPQLAQQPAPPPAPPEPDVPAAYGITANGPTTDLYTEIFGPRRSQGQ